MHVSLIKYLFFFVFQHIEETKDRKKKKQSSIHSDGLNKINTRHYMYILLEFVK